MSASKDEPARSSSAASAAPAQPPDPPRGSYAPARPSDLRSPCPMINCLANHGYIPRDGRNVRSDELLAAVREIGVGSCLAALFAHSIYLERRHYYDENQDQDGDQHHPNSGSSMQTPPPPRTSSSSSWLLQPLGRRFGLWRPGRWDAAGRRVIDLNQLAAAGVIEHDVSLTRRDYAQAAGNQALQRDLAEGVLLASRDGRFVTAADLAALRRHRIAVQRRDNPALRYGAFQHLLAAGETALILDLLGDGRKVPLDYLRPFLLDERLPFHEGWARRRWWTLGFLELQLSILKVLIFTGFKL